jgi:hypothetical protein
MNKKTLNDNKSSASKISEKKQIMDDIRAKYAYEILNRLADEDAKISKRIEELAFEYLREVDPDDVADGVFHDLDSLEVEDVWDKSGGTRHGYVDPHVYFIQVFEEWEKGNKDLNNLDEMHLFIKKNCAKWYKDIEKR